MAEWLTTIDGNHFRLEDCVAISTQTPESGQIQVFAYAHVPGSNRQIGYRITADTRDRIIGRRQDESTPPPLRPMVDLTPSDGEVLLAPGSSLPLSLYKPMLVGKLTLHDPHGFMIRLSPGCYMPTRCFDGWLPLPAFALPGSAA